MIPGNRSAALTGRY